MTDSDPPLYKPIPRRNFILGDSFDPSPTETPTNESLNPSSSTDTLANGATTPSGLSKRDQSVRNLTASALFGIYGPSAYDSVPGTPGATRHSSTANLLLTSLNGNASSNNSPISPTNDFSGSDGSTLPSRRSRPIANVTRPSQLRSKRKQQDSVLRQAGRVLLLFLAGASYSLIIARLHDRGQIAPVKVPVERDTPGYLAFWGLAAVVLGSLMPWVDRMWEEYVWQSGGEREDADKRENGMAASGTARNERAEWELAPVWNPAVRSIGAFVGIAYAIRKLPWQSTSQASLTLAFINPVLWYLLDRTRTGFWLSTFVAIFGSLFLIGFNPDFVAIPSEDGVNIIEKLRMTAISGHGGAELQMQVIGATTWIASVLYVSSLCFGNLGRKLNGGGKEVL
ncbi:hypothetical protein ABW20_dc0100168 [Dactylellina cionopaga]|nr:hypothetical protein ABW20_dc0100168 [Dactylellina cionopaga]